MMLSLTSFTGLMRLLEIVSDRHEELPDDIAAFGPAILSLVKELSVSFHSSIIFPEANS